MVKRRQSSVCLVMGVVLLAAAPAWAQSQPVGGIRGITYDKDFNVPVGEVQVTIAETGKRTVTDGQGNFVFPEVTGGTYTLIFTKEGFARQIKANIVVGAGQMSDVDIVRLPSEFTDLDELIVQDLPIAPTVINVPAPPGLDSALLEVRHDAAAQVDLIGKEMIKQSGAGDAAAVLKYVAGASVQDGKYAVIRGLPDRYVNSQMNGVRLPTADVDKRAVQLDQFPAAAIESIQVTKTFTPDQQGDASGGAVNVILKGVPKQTFLTLSSQATYNSQTTGRNDFLSYRGGGVSLLGFDGGGRDIPLSFLGPNGGSSTDAMGVSKRDAPLNSKWILSTGVKQDLADDYKIGGLLNLTYERINNSYRDGVDDRYVIDVQHHLVPEGFNPDVGENQSLHLYDVSRSSQEIKWSELATVGIESKEQALTFVHLYTHAAEDSATLTQDVRGKQYIFPGYNPKDPNSPGFDSPLTAPYLRGETLLYRERTTETFQLHGRHVLPFPDFGIRNVMVFSAPEFDWTVALSSSGINEPDKRQFGTEFIPGREIDLGGGPPLVIPPSQLPYRPGSTNINLGNVQRIWKTVDESSTQYFMNLKYPFKQWDGLDGYFKFGIFNDDVNRQYRQESFSNSAEIVQGPHFNGEFDDFWSAHYPFEGHVLTAADTDANYDGKQNISAFYWMADVPLNAYLNVIGGFRFESTRLNTTIVDPEQFVFWVPPGSSSLVQLHPGDADVAFKQDDVLPSLGLVFRPVKEVTIRTSYTQTTARQTFKELTPIVQSEYFGGPVFIGNPALKMSALKNYDLRIDYTPYEGALLSASYFYKEVRNPIEYVQNNVGFTYTTPENYPKGNLSGVEMEVRQDLGYFSKGFTGLTVGGNATLIHSEVNLPREEANRFSPALVKRDMTNAPAHLYNIYSNYDIKQTGTQLSLFYSVRGDTLVAGAGGSSAGIIIPSVYETEYGTLNFGITQKLGEYVTIAFQAKNLTNSPIRSVYRSDILQHDALKTSRTNGVDLSLSISGDFKF